MFNSDTKFSAALDLCRVTNASGDSIASSIKRNGKLQRSATTMDHTTSHTTIKHLALLQPIPHCPNTYLETGRPAGYHTERKRPSQRATPSEHPRVVQQMCSGDTRGPQRVDKAPAVAKRSLIRRAITRTSKTDIILPMKY